MPTDLRDQAGIGNFFIEDQRGVVGRPVSPETVHASLNLRPTRKLLFIKNRLWRRLIP